MRTWISDHWYTWDALRALGNQRLVQLTVLIPIVGYLVLFNEHLVQYWTLSRELFDAQSVFDLFGGNESGQAPVAVVSYRLYCLYFGLCLIALASALFSLFCPRYVKVYASAAEFVAMEERIMLPERLAEMKRRVILDYFDKRFPESRYDHNQVMNYDDCVDHGGVNLPGETGSEEETIAINEIKEMQQAMSVFGHELSIAGAMTRWFVPQKYTKPGLRFAVWALYAVGFVVLGIPTLDVFFLVLLTLIT